MTYRSPFENNRSDVCEATQQPSFDAREMLGNNLTARIQLDSQTYILRLTRQGKLILTK